MSELCARLAMLAAQGQTETYGSMAQALGLRIGELTAALEALMELDAAAGAPLRAALCEARLGNGLPAPGFFEKAAALGLSGLEPPEDFVVTTRNVLYATAKTRI